MSPAFGPAEVKGLVPYFMDTATKAREFRLHSILKADCVSHCQLVDKWNDIIENSKTGNSANIDANMWLGRAALDACVLALSLGLRGWLTNLELVP